MVIQIFCKDISILLNGYRIRSAPNNIRLGKCCLPNSTTYQSQNIRCAY